jgi:Skp family chaperone for outer membrane proteins
MIRRLLPAVPLAALVGMVSVMLPLAASAQSQDYFVPGQQRQPAAPARPSPPPPPPRPQRNPVQVAPQLPPVSEAPAQPAPQVQVQLPPAVDIPTLPHGAGPPAAVLGVLGVPDVMRASTAAQQVERTIGERRQKLNDDAKKSPFPISALLAAGFLSGQLSEAEATYRDLTQALANDRGKLSPEQLRSRERELQDELAKVKRDFRERGAIVQQAAQYGLAQIERTLVGVIQKVAESRGMNLVLHRQQVALNVNDFDITEAVVEQINKVLPTVVIPPDGVSPAAMTPPAAKTVAAPAPTPASAPAPVQPAAPAKK